MKTNLKGLLILIWLVITIVCVYRHLWILLYFLGAFAAIKLYFSIAENCEPDYEKEEKEHEHMEMDSTGRLRVVNEIFED